VTKVKICGVTSVADAELAVGHGAWAVGLILWDGSPRQCSPEQAQAIGSELHRRAEVAGVFVNAPLDEVTLAADAYGLSLIQLHGDEGPAYCRELARRTGCRVIKAARVKDAASVRDLGAFNTDFHLLDTHIAGLQGGTGETFAWDLARHHLGTVPLILSGGLTPDNVGEAIATVHPFAVDTASGTEASPGIKDPGLVAAFFEAVHAADPEPEPVPARDADPQAAPDASDQEPAEA
jgi:phosphoribosylanthranilate isomerase